MTNLSSQTEVLGLREALAAIEQRDIFGKTAVDRAMEAISATEQRDIFGKTAVERAMEAISATEQRDIFGKTGAERVMEALSVVGQRDIFGKTAAERMMEAISAAEQRDIFGKTAAERMMEALSVVGQRDIFGKTAIDDAFNTALAARNLRLPEALCEYRTPTDIFAAKLLVAQTQEWWQQPMHLEAFGRTSAVSDLLSNSGRIDARLYSGVRAFAAEPLPNLRTLQEHQQFFDAAGLILPRAPRIRLLSVAEKRRRFRWKLHQKSEQPHVRKARSLNDRYEHVLIEMIDAGMAAVYGEDWALSRLPLCDCKDLLGKWNRKGGDVMEHADFAHYAKIATHPEHFSAIFAAGFDDSAYLRDLLLTAGRLRAKSHHAYRARTFTSVDLRDLRLTWRQIEAGLLELTPHFDIEPS